MITPITYTHDTTREELVARFRNHIATDSRTKLSKDERAELALHFVDRLSRCQSEAEAIALCRAEIALLEEGYPVASIANQYLPEWRKAITLAVEEGRLPKQDLEPNEFGKVYAHWGLKHLLYPNEVHKALKEKTTAANNQKQDELQPIRADRFITKARDLLAGEHPYEWAVGLMAVTGRRFSEIVAKGQFSPTGHPYAIAFKGQLKKGIQDIEQAQTFLIATLVEADKVLETLEKFRANPRIQELSKLTPDEINSRLNTSVRHYIKRDFETTIVPILTGEKSVSAHNLRGVYAEIAVHFFCPPNQGTHRFVQAHLGHIIGDRELANRKNAGATEHYFHYRLVGAQGQQLNEKGILLERVGTLPTTVELAPEEAAQPALNIIEPEQETQPMAIAHTEATHPRIRKTQVPTDLMHELKVVAAQKLKVEGSHAEVLDAVIEFLVDDKTPTIATSVESIGSTLNWFTQEVERLRQQVQQLTVERDQARQERDQALQQGQDMGALAELRAENERLQTELAQFQQLKQLLGVNGNTPTATSQPTAVIPTLSQPIAVPRTSEKRVRLPDDESLENINQAIDAIIAWNDAPGREFNNKWYVSIPVLQQLLRGSGFSASQPRVQTAIEQRREELDQHHNQHNLGSRHNRLHPKPITEDIVL